MESQPQNPEFRINSENCTHGHEALTQTKSKTHMSWINPCHAEYFYVPHSSPTFTMLASSIIQLMY